MMEFFVVQQDQCELVEASGLPSSYFQEMASLFASQTDKLHIQLAFLLRKELPELVDFSACSSSLNDGNDLAFYAKGQLNLL